jgi:hypothetical protein
VDWSLEGDHLGFAGPSARPCIVWCEERRVRKEPFFLVECVPSQESCDWSLCQQRFQLAFLACPTMHRPQALWYSRRCNENIEACRKTVNRCIDS